MALFLLYAMSQILSAFCLQKKLKVFGECIITEKKRSGFEVITWRSHGCITKNSRREESFLLAKKAESIWRMHNH